MSIVGVVTRPSAAIQIALSFLYEPAPRSAIRAQLPHTTSRAFMDTLWGPWRMAVRGHSGHTVIQHVLQVALSRAATCSDEAQLCIALRIQHRLV